MIRRIVSAFRWFFVDDVPNVPIEIEPDQKQPSQDQGHGLYYEIFEDARREWRWRLCARNHEILAVGGESHPTRALCLRSLRRVQGTGQKRIPVLPGSRRMHRGSRS